MKDKQSFEKSIREKSRALIAERKRRKKTLLYSTSTLCVCFIVAFGIYITLPDFMQKGDMAAPESNEIGADRYYGDMDAASAEGADGAHDILDEVDKNAEQSGETDRVPEKTTAASVPTTIAPTTSTVAAVVTTSATPTPTEKPSVPPDSESIESATVYTGEVVTHTKDPSDISALLKILDSYEIKPTEQTGNQTVKVVFATGEAKLVYYFTRNDIDGIAP